MGYSQGSAQVPAMTPMFPQEPPQGIQPPPPPPHQLIDNQGYMPPAEALTSHPHDPIVAPPQIIAVSPYLDPSITVAPSPLNQTNK